MVKNILIPIILFTFFNVNAQGTSSLNKMSLKEAIEYAKKNSLLIANNKIDELNANERVKQIKAIGLPQVNANTGYNQFLQVPGQYVQFPGAPGYTFLQFQQPYGLQATITASQLIFDGSYLIGLKAIKEYIQVGKLLTAKTEQDLEYNIALAYLQTVATSSNINIISSNIKTVDSSLRMTQAMYTEGFVEKLDLDRLQLAKSNLENQKSKLEGVVLIFNNVLKMQLGLLATQTLELTDDLNTLNTLIQIPNTEEVGKRIEIQLLSQQLILNQLNIKSLVNKKYPTVAGFAQHQQQTQRPTFNFFESNLTPNNKFVGSTLIGLQVNIGIFDGFANKSKIREAKNNSLKIKNDLENFNILTSMQFSNANIMYLQSVNSLAEQQKSINLATDIYKRTKIKFQEGVGSAIEITQAETDMVTASTEYLNALNEVVKSKIEIKKIVGKSILEQ